MDAIQGGFTRYTNVDGTDELKDAIIAKFGRDNGLTYERSQILVSAGAKQVLYNLAMALIDPGDEVIIPAPYWVSYPDIVLLADGLPVTPFAGMAQGYKITPRQLAAAITPQTRLLLLNSPCNPTGAAYTHAELRGLGEVLLEHPRILIGTDDMYEKIYWEPEPFCSLVTAVPGTTRDPVDTTVTFQGQRVLLVDTAGIRRRGLTSGVEQYSLLRGLRAMERADIGIVVIDAKDGITAQDVHIAG